MYITNKLYKNNTSGFRGVHWCNSKKAWLANITINKKVICLGKFSTAEEASKAYENELMKHFTEEELIPVDYKEYAKNWKNKNLDKVKGYTKKDLEKYPNRSKDYNRKLKLEIIENYGGFCKCCNEDKIEFLSISQIDTSIINHRKDKGSRLYNWIRQNNFPEEFRLLCLNCSCSRANHGYCPHRNLPEDAETKTEVISRYKKHKQKLKLLAFEAYGNKCQCCCENLIELLTLDHIAGNGAEERKTQGIGSEFYRWLRNNNYPKNNIRLLCWNCNMSRGIYGYCPHTKERKDNGQA